MPTPRSLWSAALFVVATFPACSGGGSPVSSPVAAATTPAATAPAASPRSSATATATAGTAAPVASASATPTGAATTTSSTPYTCPAASTSSGTLDCTTLPLDDLKFSTVGAQVGSVYVCNAPSSGSPIISSAPWIDSATNTWDVTKKVAVQGTVGWTGAFSETLSSDGSTRTVTAGGVPISPYTTGTYPISSSDPAYAYDRNPNRIAGHSIDFTFPATPTANSTPTCMASGGTIGVTVTGVAIYNAFDAHGYDGAAREEQDACHGHPDQSSTYHYHGFIQTCSNDAGSLTTNSTLLGYALDGFGIYGPWYDGKILTSADLDVCHGTTSAVMWDGTLRTIYHYVSTYDFPYTLGCYRGTPVNT
jgi:hypothetical protein